MLNGFDGNRQQVVYEADFFLQKRLGMRDPAKHPVEAGHGVHPRADFLVGREELFARILIAELGFVGKDR